MFSQGKVTTGASLWRAAAIGLSVGLGLWVEAALTTLLALVVIRLVKIAESDLTHRPKSDAP